MKNILKFILILCLPAIAAAKKPESLPEYSIGKTVLDKTLKKTESVFNLIFYTSGNPLKEQPVRLAYNGKEQTVRTTTKGNFSLKVKPGKYKFQFFYNDRFFEITTDSIGIKSGFKTPVYVYFNSSEFPVMAEKPVIYVYSPTETNVTVKLEPKGNFNFTYPEYNKGWNFTAIPDGNLKMKDKTYPYLFWDGPLNINTGEINIKQGYHVSKDKLLDFFENKLEAMGLNAKEKTDFITYWFPAMSKHDAFYIHFIFNEEYDRYAPITVEPKPDNIFRVFMLWEPFDKNAEVTKLTEQSIPSIKREGLTVIEWGGGELNSTSIVECK